MSLSVKHLFHIYSPGSPFEQVALDDVSMEIPDGAFAAIIGHTGSGKSTLVQHFNGLLKPTRGQILVDGVDIAEKTAQARQIRQKIGLVFQYPEYQLFEETVYKDIAFGPKNMGLSEKEIEQRVIKACEMVNLDFGYFVQKSPFELSGGQKRRVAIAGVLAMEPSILILDEPTAGLDPKGREEILQLVKKWHENGTTIIMVSHSMDDVARFADHVFVFAKGRLCFQGSPAEVFEQEAALVEMGLDIPQIAKLGMRLRKQGFAIPKDCFSMDELQQRLLAELLMRRKER